MVAACGGGGGGGGGDAAVTPPEAPPAETPQQPGGAALKLAVLSSQADKVTGPDALVQVEIVRSTPDASVTVLANGTDVTSAFTADADGKLVGKVGNLQPGANEITATYGGESVKLALTGYAITGPVISGPHQLPFLCTTNFNVGNGAPALAPIPGDPNCGVETRVDYFYRTTANAYVHLPNPSALSAYPADLRTITVDGKAVPYVVRLETGTINRAIYQTAILHDVLNEPAPTPTKKSAGWNGKLFYTLGGGCQGGWMQQGASTGGVMSDGYLSRGFAVASSTLNVMGNNCNDLLSSETIMMVKERFVENYGAPLFTIGTGGSGGAYQSNQTGDNYPGLFDGIIISQVFADVNSSTLFKQFDSRLLNNYFAGNGGYTVAQKQAISGYLQIANISNMSGQAGRIDPTVSFPAGVVAGVGPTFRYHPATNRGGARASVYDATKNVYGTTSEGHALRPIDNVGIQYGLKALLDKVITPAQFVDLNQKIGGLDLDLQPQSTRTAADPAVLARAYQSGRIVWGGGGLASMPIIDRRDYNDDATGGDIHTKIHSFSVRERLRKANGHVDNHVILTSDGGGAGVDTTAAMDAWLTAVKTDTSGRTLAQKVVANRPKTLVDGCLINNTFVAETQVANAGPACSAQYPAGTTPRMAAGGPLSDDIAKCQLKPLNAADYPGIAFTPAQWISLQLTFPDGVCDWSKPGVSQQPSKPWQSFGPSPTNLLFDITKQ
ncbi:hypothetical protein H8N03_17900 [Ramlibacter sp. USB13]|uniref:DUF6351 domain-containing protein n=1 Tax=Ramlibacter cellulosilyticus TaxID=2764187 RepID=A0A923MUE0_9BURK|nr:hypothetical protein [Ramlibacter cellulosilyticus]